MTTMKVLCIPIIIISLINCTTRLSDASKAGANDAGQTRIVPDISAIDVKYPLSLKDINLHDSSQPVVLNDGITSQIEQTIIDYYFNECAGDEHESNFKLKETYIATIRLPDRQETIFMVLLNHIPSGQVTSKVLFYNNVSKTFEGKTLDFNINALYNFENGKLTPSNLKTVLNITAPEIELVDTNKDGQNEFKFTRLYHNGTSNVIEMMIINIAETHLDTIAFTRQLVD